MSLSTIVPSNAGHVTIIELVIAKTDVSIPPIEYLNVLHYRCSQKAGWIDGDDHPTFDDFAGAIWDQLHPAFLDPWNVEATLLRLDMREVIDAHLDTHGEPRLDYGATATKNGIDLPFNAGGAGAGSFRPSFVSIYCRKKVAHSPRDYLGSMRIGPVCDGWDDDEPIDRLDEPTRAGLETNFNNQLIADVDIPCSTSGNILTATCGLLLKKSVVGTMTPWLFCPALEEVKVRKTLGTQNTRKRARGVY